MSERTQFLILKYSFICLNLLIFLSGCVMLVTSVVLLAHYGDYNLYANHKFANAVASTLVVSTCLISIGIFGCYSAVQESYRFLMWFSILLIIIFTAEIIVGSILLNHVQQVEVVTREALHKAIHDYDETRAAKDLIVWVQKEFRCCGSDNGSVDYNNNTICTSGGVPSCHEGDSCKGKLYNRGCAVPFSAFLKKYTLVVGVVAAGFAWLFNSISIALGCLLMRIIPDKDKYELI